MTWQYIHAIDHGRPFDAFDMNGRLVMSGLAKPSVLPSFSTRHHQFGYPHHHRVKHNERLAPLALSPRAEFKYVPRKEEWSMVPWPVAGGLRFPPHSSTPVQLAST